MKISCITLFILMFLLSCINEDNYNYNTLLKRKNDLINYSNCNQLIKYDKSIQIINNNIIIGMATIGSDNWVNIAYGNGKYVIISSGGTFSYSSDGINWSTPTLISDLVSSWSDIIYANGIFVIGGGFGYISTSSNGINWTTPIKTKLSSISSICYGNNRFIALGDNSVVYSDDNCQSWSSKIVAISGSGVYSIKCCTYANNKFVLGYNTRGSNFSYSRTSTNGIDWDSNPGTITKISSLNDIIFTGDKFICVGASYNNTGGIATSTDGSNWTSVKDISDYVLTAIDYKNNKLVAIAYRNLTNNPITRKGYYILSEDQGNNWSEFKEIDIDTPNDIIIM